MIFNRKNYVVFIPKTQMYFADMEKYKVDRSAGVRRAMRFTWDEADDVKIALAAHDIPCVVLKV